MIDTRRETLWVGGAGDSLEEAYRRLTGRDFEPGRCLFEEVAAGWTRYVFRDYVEVTVAFDGPSLIERVVPGAGGASACSAHRVPEPGCPLCGTPGLRREGGGGGAG
jgi:hypothetical protein